CNLPGPGMSRYPRTELSIPWEVLLQGGDRGVRRRAVANGNYTQRFPMELIAAGRPRLSRKLHARQVPDPHRTPAVLDAPARGDPGEAGHRARARVGQAHVGRHVDVAKDDVAQAVVAAAVTALDLRDLDALALAERVREEDVGLALDGPGLALVVAHVQAP